LFLVLGACLFLGLWEPSTFLDRDFYIWALVLLALLLVHEAQGVGAPARKADTTQSDPAPLSLGSGPTRHLVAPARIVRLAAADDYTEVFIAGAQPVLHPEPLHKLIDRLPGFVRVHRSHAVNLAHLESFRRGSRSSVTLSDQSQAPVSRRCLPKLIAAISA
jgi:DNA-binding LytR/AlgR family response regulator